ncbi:SGNH/GDSL hydrolase family protein [Isoptericola variabilis]|nr:SGNH/GDSL hydrolase family protein [Isoptericola variabilis]
MRLPSRWYEGVPVAVVLAAAGALVGPTAVAAPPGPLTYDALGDSYASGYGVPPYDGACGRSEAAYAAQVDGRVRIDLDDLAACAGATTVSMVGGGQLDAFDEETRLVTLSIGGNDTGWSQAVTACLVRDDASCTAALDTVTGRIATTLPLLLDRAYTQVRARAPRAEVIVTGYPRLFSPEHGAYGGASVEKQERLNAGADLLNAVIAQAAAQHGFRFVDVTARFAGHGVNAPEPWILPSGDPGAFHPNAEGYRAYATAVTVAVARAGIR